MLNKKESVKLMEKNVNVMGLKSFVLLLSILFLTISSLAFISAAYARTYTYTPTTFQAHSGTGSIDFSPFVFNREMCQAGQDFILQVNPLGCTPSVVRSDLLEEQNVPIFCPIVATKLNPLIDVKAINSMRFTFNPPAPREVQGLSYVPARAALAAPDLQVNQPVLNNLGYIVIVLKRQPNETAMPNFVQGNLTATLRYDIKNAFSVGQANYYLPEIADEEEWEQNLVKYGFWRGKGYVRAEGIDDDSATISVYSDREAYGTKASGGKRKIASANLKVDGNLTVPMPGFNYCLGSMQVKLNGLENPGTRAKLTVNEDVFELKEGANFLDENRCTVRKIEKYGIVQKVEISCRQDESSKPLTLILSPKVKLRIGNVDGEYGMGDKLYQTADGSSVYLVFVKTREDTDSEGDLFIVTATILGKNDEKLNDGEVASMGRFLNRFSLAKMEKIDSLGADEANDFERFLSAKESFVKEVFTRKNFKYIPTGKTEKVLGRDIQLLGFASAVDEEFPKTAEGTDLKNNYEKAKDDYETIRKDFSSDLYPKTGSDERTLGEKALFNYIELAWNTNKKETASELCKEFSETYPDSAEVPAVCGDVLKLSSPERGVQSVLINGRTYLIAFDGVKEPSFEDFGAKIFVSGPGINTALELRENEIQYINEAKGEYIQLLDLTQNEAKVRINVETKGTNEATRTLKKGLSEKFGSSYTFTLQEINLKKVAKVSISPNIHYEETRANFSFKIGIEKRGIQLTPEKTKEKIASVNKTLEKWRGINARLGTVVQAGKAACLLTDGVLTAKNFLSNLGGKGIARQKVMRGTNGWFEKCQDKVDKKEYDKVDSCLIKNSDEINLSVYSVSQAMETQNKESEELQDLYKDKNGFLGEDVINTDSYMKDYVDENYRSELKTNIQGKFTDNKIQVGNEKIEVSKIIDSITPNTIFLAQARNLQLNSRLLNQGGTVGEIAKAEVRKELADIYVNNKKVDERNTFAGVFGNAASLFSSKEKLKPLEITELKTWSEVKTQSEFKGDALNDIEPDSYVYKVKDESDGQEYLLVIDNDYVIKQTYTISSGAMTAVTNESKKNPLGLSIKYFNAETYQNKFLNPEIRYFERDPYKGLPAIVPFDLKYGWYAAVKSALPFGGTIKPYDDSGRVSSFWLCNVGQNGREEFDSGVGEDICEGINLGTGQPYDQFPGFEKDASSLVKKGVEAIRVASVARERNPKVTEVIIYGQRIKVGAPAASIPDIQCQDFMSPTDCNLLFNVCDPVICPSSRCDLGGKYPVEDVVQSGVVGGLVLCLPNFPEVKVPICLSAVHAGLESYLSVLDSYKQCLQTSLETGQTVGVCDEINSVYMCDFFWRQGLPVANILIPKAVGSVLGQNVRGGGEYLGVQDAWQRAGDSAKYFSQSYATNSYKAFKARTSEDIGTEICKVWVSVKAPGGGNLLDALTTQDVPTQFYVRFDEIPLTTVTNPPISQYKVFYHIFAGKDFPAYYQVYLKGEGGTFFQDTDIRRVVPGGTGFVPVGEYITKTTDFTAPSGYKQMCIVVNNQEECGFKQVTTDFGVNYLTEKFVAEQASQTDITSEAACISGTPSALALLTPNVQSAAEGLVNPSLYNRGITRICATDNPGLGTDTKTNTSKQRWQQVGYCGDTKVKCWLDRKSVEDTIKSTATEKDVLDEVAAKNALDELNKQTQTLTEEQFDILAKEIEGVKDADAEKLAMKKIDLINKNIGRVLFNHQEGYLTLLRADAYKEIAKAIFDRIKAKEITKCEDCGRDPSNPCDEKECTEISRITGKQCSFEDNACKEIDEKGNVIGPTKPGEEPPTAQPETLDELVKATKEIELEKTL